MEVIGYIVKPATFSFGGAAVLVAVFAAGGSILESSNASEQSSHSHRTQVSSNESAPPVQNPVVASRKGKAQTMCGSGEANRTTVMNVVAWSTYTCQTRAKAKDRWQNCLQREDYSDVKGTGCPTGAKCCPPRSK
jgi:hypothetical protein